MKKNNLYKILFAFLAVLTFFTGCTSFLDGENSQESVPDGKCLICVNPGLPARSAFPSDLSDVVYGLVISYETSDETKYLTDEGITTEKKFISVQKNTGGELRFVFCAPAETAGYTLTLYAFRRGTTLESATETMASARGSAKITLSAGQKSYSEDVEIEMAENSGKGSVKLGISLSDISGIKSASVVVTKDNERDSTLDENENNKNYGFTLILDDSSGAVLSAADIPSGTYSVIMSFFNESGEEILTNSAIQEVTVYSGMTTDTWYISGKKHTTTDTSGKIVPAALFIKKYDFTQLYVKGEDSTSEDGKLCLYTSTIFGTNIPEASDTEGTGAMSKPYATIQKAVDRIMKDGNEDTEYTIYVDGTFTAKEEGFSKYVKDSNGDKKLSANFSYCSYIAIEPKANLNEGGASDTNEKAGRKIKIKGLGYLSSSESSTSSADAGASDLSYPRAVIDGAGLNTATGQTLIFSFGEGATVTLENIAITNAYGSDASDTTRPVIMNSGAELTLKNCLLDGKSFVASGINSTGGSLDLVNTTISSFGVNGINASKESEIKLTNSTVSSNKASGIKALDTNITLDSCLITKNSTDGDSANASDGGGIYFTNGDFSEDYVFTKTLTVKDSSILNNGSSEKDGGAIYACGGKIELEGSTAIKNNTAKNGGGIFINPDLTGVTQDGFSDIKTCPTLRLNIEENVSVSNNTAEVCGSAIAVEAGKDTDYNVSVDVTTCGTIDSNILKNGGGAGGAIYMGKDVNSKFTSTRLLSIKDGSISNNSATAADGSAYNASALYVGRGGVTIRPATNINICSNIGARAIYINLALKDMLSIGYPSDNNDTNDDKKNADQKINISNNPAGAIYAKNATVNMHHAILDSNGTANSDNYGSAFYLDTEAKLNINGGKITNNKNRAIQVEDKTCNVYMTGGYMEGNEGTCVKNNITYYCGAFYFTDYKSRLYISGDACCKNESNGQNMYCHIGAACLYADGDLKYTSNPYYDSNNSNDYKMLYIDCSFYYNTAIIYSGESYNVTSDDIDDFGYRTADGDSVRFIPASGNEKNYINLVSP